MAENLKIDFIGIGAPRCATTWLADCLKAHPDICFPYDKELKYFAKTRAKNTKREYDFQGIPGYYKFFKHCDKKSKKGEFSTYYLEDPEVPKIIKKHLPNVKIIVSLRDPIERAFSDYKNLKYTHLKEKYSFEKAFFEGGNVYDNYKERGMYYKQLKRYFDLFPRQNIKIIFLEDIKKNPREVIKELYQFLEVRNDFIPPMINKISNPSTITKSKSLKHTISFLAEFYRNLEKIGLGKPLSVLKRKTRANRFFENINKSNREIEEDGEKITPELRKKLVRVYLKDIEKLEKLTGRDLDNWKH